MNQSDPNPNAPFAPTTVTATNAHNDPTYGSNSYTIRWHHQYEGWHKDTSKKPVPVTDSLAPVDTSGFPSRWDIQPTAHWANFGFNYEQMHQAGVIATSIGQAYAKVPALEALYGILGMKFDELGQLIKDASVYGGSLEVRPSFDAGANNVNYQNTYTPNPVTAYGWKSDLTSDQKILIENHYEATFPRYFVTYDDTWYTGDEYDASGYKGPIDKDIWVFNPGNDTHVTYRFTLKTEP